MSLELRREITEREDKDAGRHEVCCLATTVLRGLRLSVSRTLIQRNILDKYTSKGRKHAGGR